MKVKKALIRSTSDLKPVIIEATPLPYWGLSCCDVAH